MSIRASAVVERPGGSKPSARLDFVDVARGLAVVFMVLWHTAHGWLDPSAQASGLWPVLRLLGGMAAPLFVLLAGMSAALQVARPGADVGAVTRSLLWRGLQVVVLGYVLRFQMWLVDGQAYRVAGWWRIALPLAAAYSAALIGTGRARPRRAAWLTGALALLAVGAWQTHVVLPQKIPGLFRVDVLQCIGSALALVATAARAGWLRRSPVPPIVLGLLLALATHPITARLPGPLPEPIAGYIGRWRAGGVDAPIAMFPLFPWMGFAFVGFGIALLVARARETGNLRGLLVTFAIGGLFLAAATSEWVPAVQRALTAAPIAVAPVRLLHRVGLAGFVLALSYAARRFAAPVRTLGAASLVVYWVHLEFAFGLAAAPVRRSLGLAQWCVGFVLLMAAMWCVAWARVEHWDRLSRAMSGALARRVALRRRESSKGP